MTRLPGQGRTGWIPLAVALVGFGVSFAYVEAAVVVYLRTVYEPLQQSIHPGTASGELFPAMTLEELTATTPQGLRLLKVELGRELATMVMLASFGLAVGGRPLRQFAAFMAAFGVWDIAFYAWLRLLIGWPATLWTWDMLFLLPVPWSSPVIAPMIVAATMTVCGLHTIARDAAGDPVSPGWLGWAAVVAGGALIYLAFVGNSRLVASGGVPTRFDWPLFSAGEALAAGGYVASARGGRPRLGATGGLPTSVGDPG